MSVFTSSLLLGFTNRNPFRVAYSVHGQTFDLVPQVGVTDNIARELDGLSLTALPTRRV